MGLSSRHFFQPTPRGTGVINCVQFLYCPPPKICDSQKIAQNFSRFLTTFDFDRKYLRNGSTYRTSDENLISHHPFHVEQKKLVNFGPQTKKFYWLISTNPRRYFSGDYISAIRGCCALKFLHALDIDHALLTHTPSGAGVPPKNFIRQN